MRRAQLAEDLALAGNARVEPGGDPEQVDADGLVAQAVQGAGQRLPAIARERGQDLDGACLGVGVTGEVELRAVARRDDDRVAAELLGHRTRAVEVQRDAFAQLDRRTMMGDTDQRQHRAAAGGTNALGDAVPRLDEPATNRPCTT